jgi:2-enoate reductase
MPPGCFLEVSTIVKEYFKKNDIVSNAGMGVPIVAVGKLGYPDLAEKALREEKCDMVMLGRPLLADPDWCNKAYAGKVDEIRPCIGCQEGCINEFVEGGHPQCAVNPRTSFEYIMPADAGKAKKKKKICVVGAGPAGVFAAIGMSRRGHEVILVEKTGTVGGKLGAGSVPKIKYECENYRLYLERQVEKTVEEYRLKFIKNKTATSEWLTDQKPDAVVFAVGSRQAAPSFEGIEKVNAEIAEELLENPEKINKAKKAVVIGGGVVGCETAYWLKYEHGLDVKVVEMLEYFMGHTCTANRGHLIYYLKKAGVELHNCTKVTGFEENAVKVIKNVSDTVPDPYVTWHPVLPENIENPLAPKLKLEEKEMIFEADLVVMAIGGKPDDRLFFEAQKKMIAPEIYGIGDGSMVGKVLEATRAANALARSI